MSTLRLRSADVSRKLKMKRSNFQFSIFNSQFLAGFTLVEVLIVIALIGILGSLMFGNFLKSQRRGFDAQRQADMKTIQNAFEQYYVANGMYPTNDTEGGSEFPGGNLPLDPRDKNQAPGDAYEYTIEYDVGGASYCACTQVEEIEGNATALPDTAQCIFGSAPPLPYVCVESLQ